MTRSTLSKNVRQDYYVNGQTTKLTVNTTYDIGFYTSMTLNYNSSTGTIISCTQPNVTIISGPHVGSEYNGVLLSASASASKIDSHNVRSNTNISIKISFAPAGYVLTSENIAISKTAYFGT